MQTKKKLANTDNNIPKKYKSNTHQIIQNLVLKPPQVYDEIIWYTNGNTSGKKQVRRDSYLIVLHTSLCTRSIINLYESSQPIISYTSIVNKRCSLIVNWRRSKWYCKIWYCVRHCYHGWYIWWRVWNIWCPTQPLIFAAGGKSRDHSKIICHQRHTPPLFIFICQSRV